MLSAPALASQIAGCGGDDATQSAPGDGGADNTAPGLDGSSSDGSGHNDGSGGDGSGGDGSGGGDGASSDGANGDGGDAGPCQPVNTSCTSNGQCCTSTCDQNLHVCANPIGQCGQPNSACTTGNQCCSGTCIGNLCSAQLCINDNSPCSSNATCCSGICGPAVDGGPQTCTPLNNTCKTSGNSCSVNNDCCSHLCSNGRCSSQSSFCTQTGDVCSTDAECCGGLCTKTGGNALGTCTVPNAPGGSQCIVAGQFCGGNANDGGTLNEAGVPSCGGSCCSRSCFPYGPTGVDICEPPSGCHPVGEICRQDTDCCNSVSFPGQDAGNGSIRCSKANPNDPVGRCDQGTACNGAGEVCKLKSTSCNAADNCCVGNVNQNPLVCQQDILGIPRCTIAAQNCSDAGSFAGHPCASSADCCGLTCVPNPGYGDGGADAGSPFVCGALCVPKAGGCTTTADCCSGIACVIPSGGSKGTCGGGGNPDGGTGDGGSGGDGGSTTDGGGTCSQIGQLCSTAADCCNGVPCTDGRCVFPIP
jgi:hypothetical protein